jgi:serine/threonine protein kinase
LNDLCSSAASRYLPGLSLEELIERHGPMPPGRAVHLLRQLCQALREAHAVGLIHRDIKPSNIIAARRGGMDDVAKLLDFGLARVAAEAPAADLPRCPGCGGPRDHPGYERGLPGARRDGRAPRRSNRGSPRALSR